MTHVGSTSSGIDDNSLAPEFIVSEIEITLSDVMGEEVMSALSYGFERVCGISFKNNYIFENPDEFVSALRYTFGAGGEALLRLINARLAKSMSLKNAEELTECGAPCFIFLINSIKKNRDLS